MTQSDEPSKHNIGRNSNDRYQTFAPRFVAAIIDGIVIWIIGVVLSFFSNTGNEIITYGIGLINTFAPYLYSILLHGKYGQTLGKMAMNVKVIDVEENNEISMKQAFLRDSIPLALIIASTGYSIIIASDTNYQDLELNFATVAPYLLLAGLGFLWTALEIITMLFNKKSRALHDFVADTVVVRV